MQVVVNTGFTVIIWVPNLLTLWDYNNSPLHQIRLGRPGFTSTRRRVSSHYATPLKHRVGGIPSAEPSSAQPSTLVSIPVPINVQGVVSCNCTRCTSNDIIRKNLIPLSINFIVYAFPICNRKFILLRFPPVRLG